MHEPIARLLAMIEPRYAHGDPAHDLAHILRVKKTCEALGRAAGADLDVLIPAALLHDIVNLPKDHPERREAGRLAAVEAGRILGDLGYEDAAIARICQVIEEHGFSRGQRPSTLEAAILQDADRLDALGAIGIMRAVACGRAMGAAFYDAGDPFAGARALDDARFTIDHFYTKLLKLAGAMNTEQARAEAARRTATLRGFLDALRAEIGG